MYHKRMKTAGPAMVREVASSDFKNALHELLDRVAQGNEEIVITRYGKPVARLSPIGPEGEVETTIFGWLSGTVTVHGDLVEPTGEVWKADA